MPTAAKAFCNCRPGENRDPYRVIPRLPSGGRDRAQQ